MEIRIIGDKYDLMELSKIHKEKNLCIMQENDYFLLKSEDFEALSSREEVERKAIELLKNASACAILCLNSRKVIALESISWLNENGKRKEFLEDRCETYVREKTSIKSTYSHGTIEMYNQSAPTVNWMKIAQRDKEVKKAFDQINHDFNSWDAFHKIIEILEEDQFTHIRKGRKNVNDGKYRSIANKITGTANSFLDMGCLKYNYSCLNIRSRLNCYCMNIYNIF